MTAAAAIAKGRRDCAPAGVTGLGGHAGNVANGESLPLSRSAAQPSGRQGGSTEPGCFGEQGRLRRSSSQPAEATQNARF